MTVDYALTIWQPWASLVIEGIKPYEFRERALPVSMRGRRIVIHAAKRAIKPRELRDVLERLYAGKTDGMIRDRAIDLLEKVWRKEIDLPMSAGLGSAVFAGSTNCRVLFPGDPEVDAGKWGWQMMLIRKWAEPVPCSGLQAFWRWRQPLEAHQ